MDTLPSLLTLLTTLLLVVLETVAPLHRRTVAERLQHALPHAVLMVINLLVIAAIAGLLRRAEAAWPWQGPLAALGIPWLAAILGVMALDLRKYLLHHAKHTSAPLWAFHRSHHNDREFDFTTRFRFHPGEGLIDELSGFLVALVLGVGPEGFLLYRALLYPSALINHGNVRFPAWVDRVFGAVFITPAMHRVHHSMNPAEEHSNYGDLLSIWDRMFGTLRQSPAWEQVCTGVADDNGSGGLAGILVNPLIDPAAPVGVEVAS